MAGPLVEVDTIVAGIVLDVDRQLRLGPDSTLEFIKPNTNEISGWEILRSVNENFNRIAGDEKTRDDGKTIVFEVADIVGDLKETLRTKELYLRCNGVIYKVDEIPQIADNEAQVYTIYCRMRTLKTTYFDNK